MLRSTSKKEPIPPGCEGGKAGFFVIGGGEGGGKGRWRGFWGLALRSKFQGGVYTVCKKKEDMHDHTSALSNKEQKILS